MGDREEEDWIGHTRCYTLRMVKASPESTLNLAVCGVILDP